MSAPIGPGDAVECINADRKDADEYDLGFLKLGAIYRIRRLVVARGSVPACELEEATHVTPDGFRACFALDRFRPLYSRKSSLIEQLKQPVEERETV